LPTDLVFIQRWRLIADLASKYRMPSAGGSGEYPQAGGLLSYAAKFFEEFRHSTTLHGQEIAVDVGTESTAVAEIPTVLGQWRSWRLEDLEALGENLS
jgi:hypothetical protein